MGKVVAEIVMGKRVEQGERPTPEQVASARRVSHDGWHGEPFESQEHGVIVFDTDGTHTVHYTHTERYVNVVLVPFFAYYDATDRITKF